MDVDLVDAMVKQSRWHWLPITICEPLPLPSFFAFGNEASEGELRKNLISRANKQIEYVLGLTEVKICSARNRRSMESIFVNFYQLEIGGSVELHGPMVECSESVERAQLILKKNQTPGSF